MTTYPTDRAVVEGPDAIQRICARVKVLRVSGDGMPVVKVFPCHSLHTPVFDIESIEDRSTPTLHDEVWTLRRDDDWDEGLPQRVVRVTDFVPPAARAEVVALRREWASHEDFQWILEGPTA